MITTTCSKNLISTFFADLVTAFLPDAAPYLDAASLVPLDKELFTDITAGEKHIVDLLMKARFLGTDAFFLFHVENQARPQADFARRMFRYFARLHEKYNLPIYPVVIFSYDAPKRKEPSRYTVALPGRTVLRFDYKVIQLNRLSWRRFLKQPNPAAAALMAKMNIAPKDRPKVRAECLRMVGKLQLDPAKSQLIGVFIDKYLQLNADEMKRYEREVAKFAPKEQETVMEIITSWEQQGKENLLAKQIRKRFGSVAPDIAQRLNKVPAERLDDLGEALFDFTSPADLDTWLSRYAA